MPHLALLIATLIACLLPKTSLGQPDQWVTNADVMKLVAAGVDDNTVIAVIEQARLQKFDVGPEALNALRASRVPETVITAMQRISSPSPAAPSSPVPISGQAYSLVGLTEDQLRTRLRAPTTILNGVWYFDSDAETLRVYVTNGVVSEVHPADFALSTLSGASSTTSTPPPTARPSGTIVCRDGTVSDSATRQGACSSHGGIAGSTTTKKKKKG